MPRDIRFRLRPALDEGKGRILAPTEAQIKQIVQRIRKIGVRAMYLDPARLMDQLAGGDKELRKTLYGLIEGPLNEAGGLYSKSLQHASDAYLAKMKELGIGKKESRAIQRYGDGYAQETAKSEMLPYTLEDLKRDFPDKWENIVEATNVTMRIYDEYEDAINRMLETIYPNVLENAEQKASDVQKRIDVLNEKSDNQRALIAQLEKKIATLKEKLAPNAGRRTDTQAYVDLQNSLAWQKQRLENARALLETYEQRVTVKEMQRDELRHAIDNHDVLRNRRVEHRANYAHHFTRRDGGFSALKNTLTGENNIAPELAGTESIHDFTFSLHFLN